jgi:hypothetical protein
VHVDKAYLENLLGEPKRKIHNLVLGETRQVTLFDDVDHVAMTTPDQDHVLLVEGNLDALYIPHHRAKRQSPPRLAKFFLLLIPLRQREHILGDLEEEFHNILFPEYGCRWASIYYYWHVLLEIVIALAQGVKEILKVF